MTNTLVQVERKSDVVSDSMFCFVFFFLFFYALEYRAELYWRLESKRMKALSKENTPFVNEVTSADQNNNVDKASKGSKKEVTLITDTLQVP